VLDDKLTSGCTAFAGTCKAEGHRVFPDMRMCGLCIRSMRICCADRVRICRPKRHVVYVFLTDIVAFAALMLFHAFISCSCFATVASVHVDAHLGIAWQDEADCSWGYSCGFCRRTYRYACVF
jgi:hypothetical protein